MRCSVVIATFRRPESLERCLDGLERQVRLPDEVLVVLQNSDEATNAFLRARPPWSPLHPVRTDVQGTVRQYNAGLEASSGEIVAYIDDDAVALPDWMQKIEQHFERDPKLGGLGGRDFIVEQGRPLEGAATKVGVVEWFGRIIGNHHLSIPGPRNVSILKGVNMSFRRSAIGAARFDLDLRGAGAQTCCDMAFSMDIEQQGWKLMYDPQVAVNHFPATRFDADKRGVPEEIAIANHSFNVYLTLRRHMTPGVRRKMALAWAYWIGTMRTPGVLRGTFSRLRRRKDEVRWRTLARQAWQEAADATSTRSARW